MVNREESLRARLDRVVSIQNSAYDRAASPIRIALKPAVPESDIQRLEEELGRQLPGEVRTLFSWHDGCSVHLVPTVHYRGSEWSSGGFSSISKVRLPPLSNAGRKRPLGKLFPVFDDAYFAEMAHPFRSNGPPRLMGL